MMMRGAMAIMAVMALLGSGGAAMLQQDKDYLSSIEADKIRDAETGNARVKLFLTFADDRLKKFQYEVEHPSGNRHGDMLVSLRTSPISRKECLSQ